MYASAHSVPGSGGGMLGMPGLHTGGMLPMAGIAHAPSLSGNAPASATLGGTIGTLAAPPPPPASMQGMHAHPAMMHQGSNTEGSLATLPGLDNSIHRFDSMAAPHTSAPGIQVPRRTSTHNHPLPPHRSPSLTHLPSGVPYTGYVQPTPLPLSQVTSAMAGRPSFAQSQPSPASAGHDGPSLHVGAQTLASGRPVPPSHLASQHQHNVQPSPQIRPPQPRLPFGASGPGGPSYPASTASSAHQTVPVHAARQGVSPVHGTPNSFAAASAIGANIGPQHMSLLPPSQPPQVSPRPPAHINLAGYGSAFGTESRGGDVTAGRSVPPQQPLPQPTASQPHFPINLGPPGPAQFSAARTRQASWNPAGANSDSAEASSPQKSFAGPTHLGHGNTNSASASQAANQTGQAVPPYAPYPPTQLGQQPTQPPPPNQSQPPVQTSSLEESRKFFHTYLYDYLLKAGLREVAAAFLSSGVEVDLDPSTVVAMKNTKSGTGQPVNGALAVGQTGGEPMGNERTISSSGSTESSSNASHFGFPSHGRPQPNGAHPSASHGQAMYNGAGDPGTVTPSSSSPSQPSPVTYAASILPRPRATMDTEQGFLFEWWTLFWDVFRARTGRNLGGNPAAQVFVRQQLHKWVSERADAATNMGVLGYTPGGAGAGYMGGPPPQAQQAMSAAYSFGVFSHARRMADGVHELPESSRDDQARSSLPKAALSDGRMAGTNQPPSDRHTSGRGRENSLNGTAQRQGSINSLSSAVPGSQNPPSSQQTQQSAIQRDQQQRLREYETQNQMRLQQQQTLRENTGGTGGMSAPSDPFPTGQMGVMQRQIILNKMAQNNGSGVQEGSPGHSPQRTHGSPTLQSTGQPGRPSRPPSRLGAQSPPRPPPSRTSNTGGSAGSPGLKRESPSQPSTHGMGGNNDEREGGRKKQRMNSTQDTSMNQNHIAGDDANGGMQPPRSAKSTPHLTHAQLTQQQTQPSYSRPMPQGGGSGAPQAQPNKLGQLNAINAINTNASVLRHEGSMGPPSRAASATYPNTSSQTPTPTARMIAEQSPIMAIAPSPMQRPGSSSATSAVNSLGSNNNGQGVGSNGHKLNDDAMQLPMGNRRGVGQDMKTSPPGMSIGNGDNIMNVNSFLGWPAPPATTASAPPTSSSAPNGINHGVGMDLHALHCSSAPPTDAPVTDLLGLISGNSTHDGGIGDIDPSFFDHLMVGFGDTNHSDGSTVDLSMFSTGV